MISTLQTMFGVTFPVSGKAIAPPLAMALATRIGEAVTAMQSARASIVLAAELRGDAERYLAVRRLRALRLPHALEHRCDQGARALMQLTANTPPQLRTSGERLVA